MKIILTGATGLIGQALVKRLLGRHELIVFSRNIPRARTIFKDSGIQFADWHQPPSSLAAMVEGSSVLINLAGEGIGNGRWTSKRKDAILWSRIQSTELMFTLLEAAEMKLETVIQASAIGYYGFDDERSFTEEDEAGSGFLADVSKRWEKAAQKFEQLSERLLVVRTGIVLSNQGGVLPKMALPFRFFAGGKIGSGNQWMSWIDIEDEVEAILFLLDNKSSKGVYNLSAPEPVRQKEFAKQLGITLKRPSILPMPASLMRLFMGEMAEELLLNGTRALPTRLLQEGFRFHFTQLQDSLHDKLK